MGGDTPMHEVKPYVVTYAFFGFTIHHRGSKMTVARPCVVEGKDRKCLATLCGTGEE